MISQPLRILRSVSRSTYLGLLALPEEVREALALGYLLCRSADAVANTKSLSPEKRSRYLGALRGVLQGLRDPLDASREVADALLPIQEHLAGRLLLDQLAPCFKAWKGLSEPERALVKDVLESVTEAMRMDLARFKGELAAIETPAELARYCALMGGGMGVFWTRLCLLRLPALERVPAVSLIRHGLKLGQALQMTHLLRRAAADVGAGRCYFPAEQLKAAGLSPLDLRSPSAAPRLKPIVLDWVRWALAGLDNGPTYIKLLPGSEFRLRAAVILPLQLGLGNLTLIARASNLLDPDKKIEVGWWSVLGILLRMPLTTTESGLFEASCHGARTTLLKALPPVRSA